MQYTVPYREIRNVVNSSWHTVCSAILPKLLTAANAALWTFIQHGYVSIRLITITIQKKCLCVTQFQSFYVPVSIHYSFAIRYRDATTRSASRRLQAPQVTRKAIKNRPWQMLYTTLPMPICYKQAWNLAPTYRKRGHILCFCFVYYTRTPGHITTIFTLIASHYSCSNSQIPQFTTGRERKLRGNVKSQRHKRLWQPA